jgi:hypothetical protein
VPETQGTVDCIARWRDVSPEDIRGGQSADYLRRTGQEEDLEFILRHVDDLETVPGLVNGELLAVPAAIESAKQAV